MRLVDESVTGARTEQDISVDHPDAALGKRTVAMVAAVADAAMAVLSRRRWLLSRRLLLR